MGVLVMDIETVGGATKEQAAAVAEMAEAKGMEPDAFAALCPPLARVVCVGLLNLSTGGERVYLDGDLFSEPDGQSSEPGFFFCAGEKAVLGAVNVAIQGAQRIVTFNGRCFDLAVLVHRSIALGLTPTTKLLSAAREYRYKPNVHVDVRDVATFFGAASLGTLRAYSMGYGLGDPKANGGGSEVAALVASKSWLELGTYCMGDVRRTGGLYQRMSEAGLI